MDKVKEIFEQLSAEFTEVGMDGKVYPSCKWKPQTCNIKKALCVPYIDARQVSDRLNNVLGVDGWESTIEETSNNALIYNLSINIDGKVISKADMGDEQAYGGEKAKASDGLKRAAVLFGVGKYLYQMEPVSLNTAKGSNGKYVPATNDGNPLEDFGELSSYINMMHPLRSKLVEIYKSLSSEQKNVHEEHFKLLWETLSAA